MPARFADRNRIDQLIAQKARRYAEVAGQGLRFFPAAAETLGAVAARWPVAICSGALRPEIEYRTAADGPARSSRGHHFGRRHR